MSVARNVRLVDEEATFADLRAAERAACVERNALAAKTVAGFSRDVDECVQLLAMLGLDLSELK